MTKEEIKEYNKQYYLKNKEKSILYIQKNKDRISEQRKIFRMNNKELMKIQYEKAKEKRKIYRNNRRKTDDVYALKCKIRKNIYTSMNKKGFTKRSSCFKILGCEYNFFKNYIEAQFTKEMSWANIHLDHIKPIKTAKSENEVIELNHYTNFQPLLALDNLHKGCKIIEKQLRIL